MKEEHPMQPIIWASDNIVRFKSNKIIEYLFEIGKLNLNEIALMKFPKQDKEQIAQLLGYSVSGFGDLSYVRKKTIEIADLRAEQVIRKRRRARRAAHKSAGAKQ